jgi:hypothetical protein
MDSSFGGAGASAAQVAQELRMQTQTASPANGSTVTMVADGRSRILNLNPTAALNSLTVIFPPDSVAVENQLVGIATNQPILSLTLSGATVVNMIDAMDANDFFIWQRIDNHWNRRQ